MRVPSDQWFVSSSGYGLVAAGQPTVREVKAVFAARSPVFAPANGPVDPAAVISIPETCGFPEKIERVTVRSGAEGDAHHAGTPWK